MNIVIFLTFLLLLSACGEKNRDVHEHPQLKTGKALFEHHCAECHKITGNGNVIVGIPPVVYHEMKLSDIRKFIKGQSIEGRKHEVAFTTMPKKEARMIARHVNKLAAQVINK